MSSRPRVVFRVIIVASHVVVLRNVARNSLTCISSVEVASSEKCGFLVPVETLKLRAFFDWVDSYDSESSSTTLRSPDARSTAHNAKARWPPAHVTGVRPIRQAQPADFSETSARRLMAKVPRYWGRGRPWCRAVPAWPMSMSVGVGPWSPELVTTSYIYVEVFGGGDGGA